MVDVEREVKIPWDPDSGDITITTNKEKCSYKKLYVVFYDDNDEWAGGVEIRFYSPIVYYVGNCHLSSSTHFPDSLPAETDKTWKISYDQAALSLTIYCNEVEVLDVILSDVCTRDGWRSSWEQRKPTKMKFSPSDDASD